VVVEGIKGFDFGLDFFFGEAGDFGNGSADGAEGSDDGNSTCAFVKSGALEFDSDGVVSTLVSGDGGFASAAAPSLHASSFGLVVTDSKASDRLGTIRIKTSPFLKDCTVDMPCINSQRSVRLRETLA